MIVATFVALCVGNRLKCITHYILGFLIILNGCGDDTDNALDYVGNTALGVGHKPVIELSGALKRMTLKSSNTYKLIGGAVTVPSGTVLTIEPGTLIKGSDSAALVAGGRDWRENHRGRNTPGTDYLHER